MQGHKNIKTSETGIVEKMVGQVVSYKKKEARGNAYQLTVPKLQRGIPASKKLHLWVNKTSYRHESRLINGGGQPNSKTDCVRIDGKKGTPPLRVGWAAEIHTGGGMLQNKPKKDHLNARQIELRGGTRGDIAHGEIAVGLVTRSEKKEKPAGHLDSR